MKDSLCSHCPNNSEAVKPYIPMKKIMVSPDFPLSSCETALLIREFLKAVATRDLLRRVGVPLQSLSP